MRPRFPRTVAVLTRAVDSVAVALIVVILSFFLIQLVPGDPARSILGVRASEEKVAALRHQLGLDQPVARQLGEYIWSVLHGDLGQSVSRPGQSISGLLVGPFFVTLQIVVFAALLSMTLGMTSGLIAGLSRSKVLRDATDLASTLAIAIPPFVFGLVLLIVFAGGLRIAPAGGWGEGLAARLDHAWLPALALTAYLGALVHRAMYTSVLHCREQGFIEAATLRGLSASRVAVRHLLPNCLGPVISIVTLNLGALIGGAAVIEAVFDIPGIGSQLVDAVSQRDYPAIQGAVLITSLSVVIGNVIGDVLQLLTDPRTRRAQ
ncbi:ABC transporter permease [Kribbella solani]|uniref:ABC transporter permease n=1 Tax=Kribbella solani TaxID=236067 RepID=UPI0029AEB452|nr:ABC transporter permease [Kribbella solani]MDX3006564.1 ABC transporter permease [Kribbella solani]